MTKGYQLIWNISKEGGGIKHLSYDYRCTLPLLDRERGGDTFAKFSGVNDLNGGRYQIIS